MAVIGTLLWIFLEPAGYIAVKYHCAQDGGAEFRRRIKPTAFLEERPAVARLNAIARIKGSDPQDGGCRTCYLAYQAQWFAYAEHVAIRPAPPAEPTPGIYRYELVAAPDPRCGAHKPYPTDKFPENTCVAIERVPVATAPYLYTRTSETIDSTVLGVDLARTEQRLTDRKTGEVLAKIVHYGRYSSFSLTFVGESDLVWQCKATAPRANDFKGFFAAALGRDKRN